MNEPSLFPAMTIASTGLAAERCRMEVAANNLANAHSTRGEDGELYQRQTVLFSAVYGDSLGAAEGDLGGVSVDAIESDAREPLKVYAPHHPDADADGMIEEPNITTIEEMMDIISASRAYQANLSAMKQSRDMARRTIGLGQKV